LILATDEFKTLAANGKLHQYHYFEVEQVTELPKRWEAPNTFEIKLTFYKKSADEKQSKWLKFICLPSAREEETERPSFAFLHCF
jgi:hypothetical protein